MAPLNWFCYYYCKRTKTLLGTLEDFKVPQEMSELSNGKYELKEATMYPTLYRLNQNGYLDFEQVKVGVRRTRVYYSITESGRLRLKNLLQEYDTITSAIDTIISCVSQVDNKNGED